MSALSVSLHYLICYVSDAILWTDPPQAWPLEAPDLTMIKLRSLVRQNNKCRPWDHAEHQMICKQADGNVMMTHQQS